MIDRNSISLSLNYVSNSLSFIGTESEIFNYKLHRESKKTRHQTLGHNFSKYYPIFKFFPLADSAVNLQQIHV